MSSQRPRRPTAWEVSFPDESSEDENEDEEIVPEREQEQLDVLNGKRKTSSVVDDRVRFVLFSIPNFLVHVCLEYKISRRNATVGNPGCCTVKRSRNRAGIVIAHYIMLRDLMSSPSLHRTLPSS